MRIFIIISSLFLFINVGLSQGQSKNHIEYVTVIKPNVYHTIDQLDKFRKNTLKRVYRKRLRMYLELLPFLALNYRPGQDITDHKDVPMKKQRIKEAKKFSKMKEQYYQGLDRNLRKIVSYANRDEIINQILELDLLIAHMRQKLGIEK